MRLNKIRILLLISNILFMLVGFVVFATLTPRLHETAETIVINDTKARLLINTDYIIEAIQNESFKHNFGLTIYTIPSNSDGLMTDMYSFYILSPTSEVLYTTNDAYERVNSWRSKEYITQAYFQRDSYGIGRGVLGNQVYYVIARAIIDSELYLLVYEIDFEAVSDSVYRFQLVFIMGYLGAIIIIIILSFYIDHQYKIISNHQEELFETYNIIDDTGLNTNLYIRRIKKVLHTFSFTTAKLFAINKDGVVIFRNRATLEAQLEHFGEKISIAKTPDDTPWREYRDNWVNAVKDLLSTDMEYIEWKSDTIDVYGRRYFTFNRAKRIVVDGDYVIVGEIQDITDLMLANESVAKYTKYLETIYNTVHDVVMVVDLLGTIVDSNSSLETVFGYTLQELKGKNIERIVKSDCITIGHNHLLCNGMRKDGTAIKCEVYQNLLALPQEDKMQLIVIQDVTEREMLKQQIYASIAVSTETMKTLAGNL